MLRIIFASTSVCHRKVNDKIGSLSGNPNRPKAGVITPSPRAPALTLSRAFSSASSVVLGPAPPLPLPSLPRFRPHCLSACRARAQLVSYVPSGTFTGAHFLAHRWDCVPPGPALDGSRFPCHCSVSVRALLSFCSFQEDRAPAAPAPRAGSGARRVRREYLLEGNSSLRFKPQEGF